MLCCKNKRESAPLGVKPSLNLRHKPKRTGARETLSPFMFKKREDILSTVLSNHFVDRKHQIRVTEMDMDMNVCLTLDRGIHRNFFFFFF